MLNKNYFFYFLFLSVVLLNGCCKTIMKPAGLNFEFRGFSEEEVKAVDLVMIQENTNPDTIKYSITRNEFSINYEILESYTNSTLFIIINKETKLDSLTNFNTHYVSKNSRCPGKHVYSVEFNFKGNKYPMARNHAVIIKK